MIPTKGKGGMVEHDEHTLGDGVTLYSHGPAPLMPEAPVWEVRLAGMSVSAIVALVHARVGSAQIRSEFEYGRVGKSHAQVTHLASLLLADADADEARRRPRQGPGPVTQPEVVTPMAPPPIQSDRAVTRQAIAIGPVLASDLAPKRTTWPYPAPEGKLGPTFQLAIPSAREGEEQILPSPAPNMPVVPSIPAPRIPTHMGQDLRQEGIMTARPRKGPPKISPTTPEVLRGVFPAREEGTGRYSVIRPPTNQEVVHLATKRLEVDAGEFANHFRDLTTGEIDLAVDVTPGRSKK